VKVLGGCFAPNQRCPFPRRRRLLLIESPGQAAPRTKGAGGTQHDESRQKCASDLVAKALMSGAYSCEGRRASALAEDSQQERKQVDEVELEGERAHDRRASLRFTRQPLLVDLLSFCMSYA